uniref:CSON010837 protein n=1 Tax=Culicoides sonorensis TaxID=179676 RepID=A0A336M540_CULSO
MSTIQWFKNTSNKYIIATENVVRLYEVVENDHKPLITENRFKDILSRTLSTSPVNETENSMLAAFGTSTGKSVIYNFYKPESPIEIQESKQISCLDFKGLESKIAIGYEKTKDFCISLWDFSRNSPYVLSNFCGGDGVTSLCWDIDFKLLIAGLSSKHIRVYDSRQIDKNVFSVSTKHTLNGIKCSPSGIHILTYAENFIALHDLRYFDKAMSQIHTAKTIQSAQWCPTTLNLIGVSHGDQFLHLYDNINENSESSSSYLRVCSPYGKDTKFNIQSFSFKHEIDDRALVLSSCAKVVDWPIPQRNTSIFDVKDSNVMLNGSKDVKFISINGTGVKVCDKAFDEEDISQIMQKRALKDYGLIADIKENGDLSNDPQLKSVWILLARMYDKGCMLGLKSILGIKNGNVMSAPKSECEYVEWCDYPTFSPKKVYKSELRSKAISLCGWNVDFEDNFEINLSNNNYYECCRAALIACFHLKLKLAVEILRKSSCDSNDQSNVLRITAIVIDNFNPDRHNQNDILSDIKEPLLKAIFAFLNSDYESILNDSNLLLSDRMGFALRYLSDNSLIEFINQQIKTCIAQGDLNGILLVGASSEGVSLLQSYADRSDDIQSVALIASRFFTSEPFRIQYWIQTYRNILDGWNLFDQRAQLDIMMNSKITPPKAIQLLCNFCGKSISSGVQEDSRMRYIVNKISSCPNCRKTLTRCSLCMLHLGTCSTDFTDKHTKKSAAVFQAKPFSNWFSWCQTCRHGGHMKHLLTWFSQNSVCPVTDCNCCCNQIDKTLFSKMPC